MFPVIFNHLLTLDDQFKGDAFGNICEHRNEMHSISFSRGLFNGPLFDSPAEGSIGDPTVSTIKSKFEKVWIFDFRENEIKFTYP